MHSGYVIPAKEKVAYGVGDLAVNLAFDSINFYMLWFMVTVAGINPSLAGLIFLIARVWDAVTDYFMGQISDRTKSRLGMRKPYIIFGAIPMGFLFMALWYVPPFESFGRFIYYLGIYLLFNTAYTVVSVPYGALMAQMTQDFNERTALASFRVAFSFVGSLLGAAGVPLIVDVIFTQTPTQKSYLYMGVIFGLLMIFILFITGAVSKERVQGNRQSPDNFWQTIVSFAKLPEFRQVTGMFLFNAIGSAIIMALSIFYISDVLGLGENATIFMAIPLLTAIAVAPFWNSMSNAYGKRNTYIFGAVTMIIILSFVPFIPSDNIAIVGLFLFCIGFALSNTQIIPMSLLPDVIDIDEYTYHIRREGAFNGLIMFLHKASSGLAVGGVGMLIGLFGYIEVAPDQDASKIMQPEAALDAIRIVLAILPSIAFVIAIFFTWKLNITKARFDQIVKVLNKRQ